MLFNLLVIAALFITIAIRFCKDTKEAKERFAEYSDKASQIETTYGKMSYIDEGDGEVIISCHGICGGFDQAYDTLADKTDT